MKKLLGLLVTVLLCAPSIASADYLSSAFRDECPPDPTRHYTAADPVIATVPMVQSEIDRVSNNFLVYTGFTVGSTDPATDDYRGKVYGIRLFSEKTEYGNDWEFSATEDADLMVKCGDPNAACMFEAGQMLKDRTKARTIYVGRPDSEAFSLAANAAEILVPMSEMVSLSRDTPQYGLKSVWDDYVSIPPIKAALPRLIWEGGGLEVWNCSSLPAIVRSAGLCDRLASKDTNNLLNPSSWHLYRLGRMLHGVNKDWPLGDVYHASATVVEPPGFEYLDRFYPEFRDKLEKRPSMVYVAANDGMIHAFYASPDLHCEDENGDPCERWKPGEEAWAYLPMNMLSRALVASEQGEKRFPSQDLSCRYTDVQVDRQFETECTEEDQKTDPYCGWRTVLLCGQGWGGSWYVALDVTDPVAPKPMWEFTHTSLGRTWSLPSVSLVPMEVDGKVQPLWLAAFGSGYNNGMYDCFSYNSGNKTCNSSTQRAGYRILNMPFDGDYPVHGRGAGADRGVVFVQDIASGKIIKSLTSSESNSPFVADGTVLDFNYDGFVDAAYMGQYKGIERVRFGRKADDMAMCKLTDAGTGGNNKNILTGHPTAFAYPVDADADEFPVVLVTGAGVDSGRDPDQQANQGKTWSVDSFLFLEKVGGLCTTKNEYCDLAPGFNGFNDGSRAARLLGAPLFSRQANKDDWIIYTVWTAPHFNKVDGCPSERDEKTVGTAHLFCMDVTLVEKDGGMIDGGKGARCEPCKGFEKPGAEANIIYKNESNPPTAPVSADGRVYLTNPGKGLTTVGITGSNDTKPKPNSTPPSAAIPATLMSWREVY